MAIAIRYKRCMNEECFAHKDRTVFPTTDTICSSCKQELTLFGPARSGAKGSGKSKGKSGGNKSIFRPGSANPTLGKKTRKKAVKKAVKKLGYKLGSGKSAEPKSLGRKKSPKKPGPRKRGA